MKDWNTKAEPVGARRAQRPGRHAQFHHRLPVFEMRHELGREFVGVHPAEFARLPFRLNVTK